MIYTYDPDTNWASTARSKLFHLPMKVVDNPINLLDHCFHHNFYLNANLYGSYRPTSDQKLFLRNRCLIGNYFTKAAITAPSSNSVAPVLYVYDASSVLHTAYVFFRPLKPMKVFVELSRNRIAEIRLPMTICLPVK